ncbi:hypothetical protein NQ028_09165 [Corynebacterium phoceense]|uniref:hypothetical protein n=1 Tax=Corynebacterium phoceense TaxID=1686286 RepID=UPI00211C1690|nr:hypothetical protein [Corynebacterium phoceense]MCQ9341304.1 hypothetical protein [Corynebacterium phoceense]
MSKETDWFTAMANRKVTVTEIAGYLGVSRRTATNRVNDGLSSDDLITVSRNLGLSPIHALVELGKLTYAEAFDFVDGEGKLLATASTDELIFKLAQDSLPTAQLIDLGNEARDRIAKYDELAARRSSKPAPRVDPSDYDDGTVRDFEYDESEYAADSSPDEQKIREERGEDPID